MNTSPDLASFVVGVRREGGLSLRRILFALRGRPLLASRLLRLREKLTPLLGPWRPLGKEPGLSPEHASPSTGHFADYQNVALQLSWVRMQAGTHLAEGIEPRVWQAEVREKLGELMGFRHGKGSLELAHTFREILPGGLEREACYLRLTSGRYVVASVLRDPVRRGEELAPVMICLQGHTSGAHISWGEARETIDPARLARGGDFAVQAVARGFVAVCIEQSGFGERREQVVTHQWDHPCIDQANRALLLGRTLLAERVMDVCAVVNWLERTGAAYRIDPRRIYAMGNSGGGDTALYAAALDLRIAGVIAGSCVGRFCTTSGRRKSCPDTVIPGILAWLEYDDILALCAPRPVVAVSGERDHLYPFSEVAAVVAGARPVYERLGKPEHVRALAGPGGHRFYPDMAWPAFMEMI
ncbi:MAG: hypothetical protein HQL63_08285 [Magnetococcales bacterium]|nr:hypothetical protein [Magnetococcales bacterium]